MGLVTTFEGNTASIDSVQLELVLEPLVHPDYEPELGIDERFALFHAANPHVADWLEQYAIEWFEAGNKRVGVKRLYERLRWESGVKTDGEPYKLNNDFTRPYSRLLLERHPDWADAIECRESPHADRRAA